MSIPVSNLNRGLDFIAALIHSRFSDMACDQLRLELYEDDSPLAQLIARHQPNFMEYAVLMLALAPHIRPSLLDSELRAALGHEGDFAELGGVRDHDSRCFLPTGETAAFLLAGNDLAARFELQRLFSAEHWFTREGLLQLEAPRPGAPLLSGRIVMARDWVERLTLGSAQTPAFGSTFPARLIQTALAWDDLILEQDVRCRIGELENWIRHRHTLQQQWGMAGRLRPGYRALFHGPPGTGKTLTASLLGKATGCEVYRVDLSTVVSKYIGETEKNLSSLFDQARNRDWILFFDEADALFGKRTSVKDAHDRYANQEISYLLQRVDDFDGMVILATNLRANIDDAFLRRFNAIIRFPFPAAAERHAIWQRTLPAQPGREQLARQLAGYEVSGGNIVNIVQFAAIAALSDGRDHIELQDALKGIEREFEKEGKIFSALPPA